MRNRVAAVLLTLGLLVLGCGSPASSSAPTSSPTAPTSQAPTASQAPTPSQAPTSSQPPTSNQPPSSGSLPEPTLATADEIVAAMAQPEKAEQAVVSMLAALGIGLYHDDGSVVRQGLEQSDDDYYAFESEALGLVQMVHEQADPELLVTWPEYHAALAAFGLESTAEELLEAYSSAYASQPDEAITRFVLANAPMDINGQITPLGVWLLWLDAFVPGSLSTQAGAWRIATVGGSLVAVGPTGGRQRTGASARNVGQLLWDQIQPLIRQGLPMARMMTLLRTTTLHLEPDPITVHEGHSGPGSPVKYTAIVRPCGGNSPFNGQCSMPANPVLSGIHVFWSYPSTLTDHGTATAESNSAAATDARGRSSFTFTPKEEESRGQGEEMRERVDIQARVVKFEVATQVWQMELPLGAEALVGKDPFATYSATLTIVWHEEPAVPVLIVWADVYNGVEDEFTFKGTLDTIYTDGCFGDVICVTGTGIVTGDRGGWVACNPGLEGMVFSGPADATFNGVIVDDKITISAFADFDTALAGISTGPMEVPLSGGTAKIEPTTPVGDVCPHYSFGTLTVTEIEAPL